MSSGPFSIVWKQKFVKNGSVGVAVDGNIHSFGGYVPPVHKPHQNVHFAKWHASGLVSGEVNGALSQTTSDFRNKIQINFYISQCFFSSLLFYRKKI